MPIVDLFRPASSYWAWAAWFSDAAQARVRNLRHAVLVPNEVVWRMTCCVEFIRDGGPRSWTYVATTPLDALAKDALQTFVVIIWL